MEIERKFLIRAIPGGKIKKVAFTSQGYFSFDPEVRFRAKQYLEPFTLKPTGDMQYFATIKSAGTKVRDEVEGLISEEFFQHMTAVIGKSFITKWQYDMEHKGYEITANIVDKDLPTSFMYAEVEFDSEEEMEKFVWPWPNLLIKEVSDDPAYYMQNYWKRTRGE